MGISTEPSLQRISAALSRFEVLSPSLSLFLLRLSLAVLRSFPSLAVLLPDASRLADRLVLSLDAARDVADSTGGKTGSSNGFSRDGHTARAFLG